MSSQSKAIYLQASILAFTLASLNCNAQLGQQNNNRLQRFLEESSIVNFEEIKSDAVGQILKHNVYYITRKTKNTFDTSKTHEDKFIVLDTGETIVHFECLNDNTLLPKFLSLIRDDFILDPQTAPLFEDLLDIIYPIEEWKIDKREIVQKNGKWYFLRDAYFRSKQGFEVTLDSDGKIIAICYKMKWDEPDGS
ncbi:hypothetical protein [Flagellimonas iocasae]|uniref:Uncharacterized protein n=1 Tax=Flagellimonas iocasae TaxID=2055905 RepID=A0ABW4XXX6_9FLAO